MADDGELMYVRERNLPYDVFDADNHMYENADALTKFLPREYEGLIKYVDIAGRTKLAIRDHITNYIPNPTFGRVAVPGVYGLDPTQKGDGERGIPRGQRVRAMPGLDAFFDPEPRLELMADMGIDRTLLWPTLASALEERLSDDPDAACVAVHALNEWMHEHWTFNFADAIFATPIISLAKLDAALAELEYIAERGAHIFLLRVAPVPTWKGLRSFALPEFDPFWERVQELGLLVGMHAGDPGYTRFINEWEGVQREASFGHIGNPAFIALMSPKDALIDSMASIIGHGLATRFPDLKFLPVEFGSTWIRPFVAKLQRTYETSPVIFDEDPFETFKRSIYIHAFHEPDPKGLLDIGLRADHLMFGSDFPHPEGMADPLAYSEIVAELTPEDQQLIMGGTLRRLMGFEKAAA
ncbi:MAG TPA: amidohydrolase family protein [Acidimicrobiia bacterium]|nr:amidohydrolase family protein [Acidimicrobiia bacterium]